MCRCTKRCCLAVHIVSMSSVVLPLLERAAHMQDAALQAA